MKKMDGELKAIIKDASKRLTGYKRREYQAEITRKYFDGRPRKAEREMGWGRECVQKGLKETESGIRCSDNFQGRGRKRSEDTNPKLLEDIISLAEPHTQADPSMKNSLMYTKITPKAMRQALIDEKGYTGEELPAEDTIGNILNRNKYNLKRVLKSKPKKK
jgi:hypothetical protein